MGDREQLECFVPGSQVATAVADRLSLLVHQTGMEVLARAVDGLDGLGITGRDYAVLAILKDDRPASQQELARLLGKAPAIVVGAVDDLEAKGLVARRRSTEDRRRIQVVLTPAGRRTLQRADALAASVEDDLFSDLSGEQRSALHDALRQALGVPVAARA